MEIKKIVLVLLLLSIRGIIYSQFSDSDLMNFERSKYSFVAEQELVFRYNFINKYDTIFSDKNNLASLYKLKDLKVYSIPVFKLNSNKNIQFIDLIDFESNPNNQEVLVEGNHKLISVFSIKHPNFGSIIDNFTRVDFFLNYYKFDYYNEVDVPDIVGRTTYDYFTIERFERDYFCFRVEGLKGLFFVKEDKIFYATKKSPDDKTNNDYSSYDEYYEDMKTEIIEVDENFYKKHKYQLRKDSPDFEKK